jgi:hypothetical protein
MVAPGEKRRAVVPRSRASEEERLLSVVVVRPFRNNTVGLLLGSFSTAAGSGGVHTNNSNSFF